jgi:hypothetical protein
MPWPSSWGGTRCSNWAAAPPPLVMPAIEPGWEIASCWYHCRLRRARSPSSHPFCDNPPRKIPYYRLRPIHFGH